MSDAVDYAADFQQRLNTEALQVHKDNDLQGASLEECEFCGCEIPGARRDALPGVTRCIECQEHYERGALCR